ncbi:MAG: GNAT family N-acetyltransferase [Candidatus Woesearchaeota archaeon]
MGLQNQREIQGYLRRLARDVKKGLASAQDLENARRLFSGTLTLEDITGAVVEESPLIECILPKAISSAYSVTPSRRDSQEESRLSREYFLELYGQFRGHSSDDHSEFLLGTYKGVKAGGLWFFNLPEEGVKYLDMIYVVPEFRGSGLGARMIEEMLQAPSDHLSIVTFAWDKAIYFYRSLGFLKTGIISDGGKDCDGARVMLEKMILPLSSNFLDHPDFRVSDWASQYEQLMSDTSLSSPDFRRRFFQAIESSEEVVPLQDNPFTLFLYRAAKMKHSLLE